MKKLIAQKLLAAENVLIMTHLRPDGDALGSTFGLREFLRAYGIGAEVIIPHSMPGRYRQLCRGELVRVTPEELDAYDLIVSLDCANGERLGCGDALSFDLLRRRNMINIDHHRGNSLELPCCWIDPVSASACLMAAEILQQSGKTIPAQSATLLLAGMMTDTGCFCFANTDGRALRMAADMCECGADLEKISNALFFSKELRQLKFEAELVEKHLHTACDGKFAYAYIPEELLEKYQFDLKEDEGLIDIVRSVDTAVIAMLAHRREDGIRISLRSKDRNCPVAPIARYFGGGGHEMAAGCTIDVAEFAELEQVFFPHVAAVLEKKPTDETVIVN